MKKPIIIVVTLLIIGLTIFFMTRKSDSDIKKEILNYLSTDSQSSRDRMKIILEQMTSQELKDTLELLQATKAGKQISNSALQSRLNDISKKYNIFT